MAINVNSFEIKNVFEVPSVANWLSITYGNQLFAAISSTDNKIMYSSDCKSWTQRTLAINATWTAIHYGNGLFVAVSSEGIIVYSSDCITWEQATVPVAATLSAVCYGNIFVAVALDGSVLTSDDGITWTGREAPVGTWVSVCYENNLFVVVSSNSKITTSPDGIVWTQIEGESTSTPSTVEVMPYISNSWSSICYGNGLFVAVSGYSRNSSNIMTSPDGTNWTLITAPVSAQWSSVTYGGGLFVAVSTNNTDYIMISPDGITWSLYKSGRLGYWTSVCYGNGLFVASGSKIITSPDGINWTLQTTPSSTWTNVTYGNGLFVAVSNWSGDVANIITSPDGIVWTTHNPTTKRTWSYVCYGNGIFVVVSGESAYMCTSTDGIAWTERTAPATCWTDTYYDNGLFVALGCQSNKKFMTSPDGINWTLRDVPLGDWRYACYGNGLHIAISYDHTYISSSDGIAWTQYTSIIANPLAVPALASSVNSWTALAYGNGTFVAITYSTTSIMTSPNGVVWTARTLPLDKDWSEIRYGAGLFVIIGYGSDVMLTSPDGITWTPRQLASAGNWTGFCYNGEQFVITPDGGPCALTSPDGITWTERPLPADTYWDFLCYGNGLFVSIAWNSNRTLTSPDGITWTERVLPVTARWGPFYYANGIFVLLASNSTQALTSPDGITWTQRTHPYSSVDWKSLSYGAGLFVAITKTEDVMTSPDGINWTARTPTVNGASIQWSCLLYANGLFVALSSQYNKIMISSDGITWGSSAVITEGAVLSSILTNMTSIAGSNELFVAVASNTDKIITSSDGTEWTIQDIPINADWSSICYGHGVFIAIARNRGTFILSYDGTDWIERNIFNDNWSSICYGDGVFVATAAGSSQILVFPPSWLSPYIGETFDEGIDKLLAYKAGIYSWLYVDSTEASPVDLNSLVTEGNFVLDFYTNGPIRLDNSPVDLIVGQRESELFQWVFIGDMEYVRFYDVETSQYSPWGVPGTIYRGTTEPDTFIYSVWFDTTNTPIIAEKVFNGTTWIPIRVSIEFLDASIYDTTNKKTDIYAYAQQKFALNLTTLINDINTHKNNTTIHLDQTERNAFNSKLSPGAFVTMKDNATSQLHLDTDNKLTNGIDLAPIQTDFTNLDNSVDTHIANDAVHISQAEIDAYNAKAESDHTHILDGKVEITGPNITSGLFNVDRLPPDIFERAHTVATEVARLALTKTLVHNGNSVHVIETDSWYRIIDDTKLNLEEGYLLFNTPASATGEWETVSSRPDTVVGYGIEDLDTKTENDAAFSQMEADLNTDTDLDISIIGASLVPEDKMDIVTAPSIADWKSVCYGNGKFVAVGMSSNKIMVSDDGITWIAKVAPVSAAWYIICYGNKMFVAIGSGSANFMSSPDGITWTLRTVPVNADWSSVCYGNGMFVAISLGATASIITSLDGITWTTRTGATNRSWYSICYGNGIFVAIADNTSDILTSVNGIDWTLRNIGLSTYWNAVCYGNGLFVAVANSSATLATSSDGIIWDIRSMPVNAGWRTVCYGNGMFVSIAWDSNIMAVSPDGINWEQKTVPVTTNWASVCYGDGMFVAIGRTTDKIVNFVPAPTLPPTPISNMLLVQQVGLDNNRNDMIVHATDAALPDESFVIRQLLSANANTWKSICYGRGLFVAVASNNANFRTSPDGINWTLRNTSINANWQSICYGNGMFVAVGYNSIIATSPDGITWTQRTCPVAALDLRAVCYGNGNFVILGYNVAYSFTSNTGITWASHPITSRAFVGICYGNGYYVAILASGSNIVYCTDAINWTLGTLASSAAWQSVAFNPELNEFMAVSATFMQSCAASPPASWTGFTAANSPLSAIAYGNGAIVGAPFNFNKVYYGNESIQGAHIRENIPAVATYINSIAYGKGLFVTLNAANDGVLIIANTKQGCRFLNSIISDEQVVEITAINNSLASIKTIIGI